MKVYAAVVSGIVIVCHREALKDAGEIESAYNCGALYFGIEAVQSAHFIIQHC